MSYSKTTWKDRNVQYPNRFTKTDNADGTVTLNVAQGSIVEEGTPVNAANLNNIELGVEAISDATYFKEVGGSATAITVNINTQITDGLPINFICKYANGGNLTTLNGITIKRAITGTNPSFSAGQLVTVVYSQANNCFFYNAITYGNANPPQVLNGKIFSNESGTGFVGTMPNNGDLTRTIPNVGGTFNVPQGYTTGGRITGQPANVVFKDSNIQSSDKILNGYSAYGANGVLYQGSFSSYNIKSGIVPATMEGSRVMLYINNIPSEPKFTIISYDFSSINIGNDWRYIANYIYDNNSSFLQNITPKSNSPSLPNYFVHRMDAEIDMTKLSNHVLILENYQTTDRTATGYYKYDAASQTLVICHLASYSYFKNRKFAYTVFY